MEKILKIIKLKLIELLGIILIGASLIYLFSILTYSADKINYIFPEEKNIHNHFIIVFNYFSDFFLQSFGIFCLIIFINTNIWSFQIILNKNVKSFSRKLSFLFLSILLGSTFFSLISEKSFWLPDNGLGGFVGNYISESLSLNNSIY